MPNNRPGQKIKMTSIDELLCVPDSSGTTEIAIRDIYPFENHPFKVLDDEKMDELVESIKENGILPSCEVFVNHRHIYSYCFRMDLYNCIHTFCLPYGMFLPSARLDLYCLFFLVP